MNIHNVSIVMSENLEAYPPMDMVWAWSAVTMMRVSAVSTRLVAVSTADSRPRVSRRALAACMALLN